MDGAAALWGNRIIAAAEEERFIRYKTPRTYPVVQQILLARSSS